MGVTQGVQVIGFDSTCDLCIVQRELCPHFWHEVETIYGQFPFPSRVCLVSTTVYGFHGQEAARVGEV